MTIYRYRLLALDIDKLSKSVPGSLVQENSGPDIFVDISASSLYKDDLDEAMAKICYSFYAQDPVLTPSQQHAVLTSTSAKDAVRAATTDNIVLSGLQTIDGVPLYDGYRVLVKDQTNSAQNGIYNASSSAWARSTDADEASKLIDGMYVAVLSGIRHRSTFWILMHPEALVLGSTSLNFSQASNEHSDSLIYNLAEDSFEEFIYSGSKIVCIINWTDQSKQYKLREHQFTYLGNKILQQIDVQYDEHGIENQRLTSNYTYTGNRIMSATLIKEFS